MDKKFIDGIYSYCDRWCERCSLTIRCRVYERNSKLMAEPLDINCQAFWQMISSNFRRAGELLHEAAVEEGIDLTAISEDKILEVEEQQQVVEATAAAHP